MKTIRMACNIWFYNENCTSLYYFVFIVHASAYRSLWIYLAPVLTGLGQHVWILWAWWDPIAVQRLSGAFIQSSVQQREYKLVVRERGRERMEKFCIIMFNNNCLSIDRSLVIYTNILVITLSIPQNMRELSVEVSSSQFHAAIYNWFEFGPEGYPRCPSRCLFFWLNGLLCQFQ